MRLNNLRNLDSESLFYNYFKRPICHDINLMLSINSFINIGISELTYDENLSNYYISIINKDLIGNLNLYIQIDNLEFNINSSEIKEKIFSVKQITYYSPNEKNKDIIYFFLSMIMILFMITIILFLVFYKIIILLTNIWKDFYFLLLVIYVK